MLTAVKVSLRDNVRLEADVASVDVTAKSLLAGLPRGNGQRQSTDRIQGWRRIACATGRAEPSADSWPPGCRQHDRLTQLEQRSTGSNSRVIVQVPVSAISGTNSVTLLGIVADTSSVSDNEFKDTSDTPIGRAAFYAAIKVGSLVKARADLGGTRWCGTRWRSKTDAVQRVRR